MRSRRSKRAAERRWRCLSSQPSSGGAGSSGSERLRERHGNSRGDRWGVERLGVAIPVAFVAAMVATNVAPVIGWDRSLDAFRAEVIQTQGVADAVDVLPSGRRNVLWGWTASSLSLIVRRDPEQAGILVNPEPVLAYPSHPTMHTLNSTTRTPGDGSRAASFVRHAVAFHETPPDDGHRDPRLPPSRRRCCHGSHFARERPPTWSRAAPGT